MAANATAKGWVLTSVCCCVYRRKSENFNFDEVQQDLEAQNLTGGIKHVLMKRHSGRKHDAKEEFLL
ncbi:hypothetical protein Hanom_Chr05g00426691 [Helianthus anomalus]